VSTLPPDLFRSWRRSISGVENMSHVSDQACVVLGETHRPSSAGDGSTGMMSGPHAAVANPPASKAIEPPRPAARLRLKPEALTTGYVDGAWWPRTRNLSAELPALLAVLAARPGRIERVSYELTAWRPHGRRLLIGGEVVRFEGFRSQRPGTVTVIGKGRQRLTLLVVPPDTDPAEAWRTLAAASQPGNVDSVDELLFLGRRTGHRRPRVRTRLAREPRGTYSPGAR
jgi:hypothetical protein